MIETFLFVRLGEESVIARSLEIAEVLRGGGRRQRWVKYNILQVHGLRWVMEVTAVCGRGVAYRPHSWAMFAAQCWLKAIGNGDEHRTLGSQSCERLGESDVDYGCFTLPFLLPSNVLFGFCKMQEC